MLVFSPFALVNAQGTDCDAAYLDTCHGVAPLKSCGIGAKYEVGGVVTGLQLEDVECLYPEFYSRLDTDGLTTDENADRISFTALSFDVYYDSLANAGSVPGSEVPRCVIEEDWILTTVYPNPLQCSLEGPCTLEGNCETLVSSRGSLDGIAYRVEIMADDLFATLPLGSVESTVPFDVGQILRFKDGIDPNDDEEDNQIVLFYDDTGSDNDSDDDESYSIQFDAGSSTPGSADDDTDDSGGPIFWDNDNDNNFSRGGASSNSGVLAPCYQRAGHLMSTIGHLYSNSGDNPSTYGCYGSNNPSICACTVGQVGCSKRALNPGAAFASPFLPVELFAIYANNLVVPEEAADRSSSDCDVTADAIRGCPFGPLPKTWAQRAQGDDTDDEGMDDDDDDALQDSTKSRAAGGDGIWLAMDRTALMGQWSSFIANGVNDNRTLSVDLYRTLTRSGGSQADGGAFSMNPGMATKTYFTAPTASYCSPGVTTPTLQALRYLQFDISPRCDVYVPPSTGSDAYKTTWGMGGTFTPFVRGVLQVDESVSFESYTRISGSAVTLAHTKANGDGVGYQVQIGTDVQQPPISDLDGLYAVVVCESDPGFSFTDSSLEIAPYRRLEGRGRGLTPLDEGRANVDEEKRGEQLWFTLNEADYATWSGTCDWIGPAGTYYDTDNALYQVQETSSVGYTCGGIQSTSFQDIDGPNYNTGVSSSIEWLLADAATDLQPLISGGVRSAMCRPYNTEDGTGAGTFTPSPSFAAAAMEAWKASADGISAADDMPANDANDAYATSSAGRFTPAGFRVSPSASQWVTLGDGNNRFYLGSEPLEPYSDPLTGDPVDITDGTVDPDGIRQPTFRFTFFLTQNEVSFGGSIVGVESITVESTQPGATTLCPLLASSCDANSALPTTTDDASSRCGHTAIYLDLQQTARINAGITIQFDFDQCLAQGLAPFCLEPQPDESNNFCSAILAGSTLMNGTISATSDSASFTQLQSVNNVVYFRDTGADGGDAVAATCNSVCPVVLKEMIGDEFVPIAEATISSCRTGSDAGLYGCAGLPSPTATRTPSETPSVSFSATATVTPSATLSVGATGSSTPSATATSTNSATRSPSPSQTETPKRSRSAGAEAQSQTRTPDALHPMSAGAVQSPSPSPTAYPSLSSNMDYYQQSNDTCELFELVCKCEADFFSFDCLLDISLLSGIILSILAAFAVVAYIVARQVRSSRQKKSDEKLSKSL